MTDFKSELREILDSYYRSRELDERLYEQGENSHKTMLIDVETSTTKAESDIIALFISNGRVHSPLVEFQFKRIKNGELMTGQAWYNKFEAEVNSTFDRSKGWTGYLDNYGTEDFLEAAQRASGIKE